MIAFPYSLVGAVLGTLTFVGVALLVCLILTRNMREGTPNALPLFLILTGFYSLALALRYGVSLVAMQGLLLFLILLYASCSDLTSHTMDDYLWVMVGILGLLSCYGVGLPSMLIGAAMVFVPQILLAL